MMKKYAVLFLIFCLSCSTTSEKKNKIKSYNKTLDKKELILDNSEIKNFSTSKDENFEKIVIPSDLFDKPLDVSKLITDVKIVTLETNYIALIGSVKTILFDSNSYFIHDQKNNKLLRFDSEGYFLNKIGVLGKGPRENRSVSDIAFDVNKKRISIYDMRKRKITSYKYSGEFIDTNPTFYSFSQHEYLDDGFVFKIGAITGGHIPQIKSYSLLFADKNHRPIKRAFKNPKKPLKFTVLNRLTKTHDKVYYNHRLSNEFYEVKKDSLKLVAEFEFEKNGIPEDLWKQNNLSINEFKRISSKNFFLGNRYIITDDICYTNVIGGNRGRTANVFYNRKSKSILYGISKRIEDSNVQESDVLYNYPYAYDQETNRFISILYPEKLLSFSNKHPNLFSKETKETLKYIKETDNPIILTYKLKDF
jgi:hypothetical protein